MGAPRGNKNASGKHHSVTGGAKSFLHAKKGRKAIHAKMKKNRIDYLVKAINTPYVHKRDK